MNYHFIAGDILDLGNFLDVGKFVDTYPDFQTVTLNNENELKILLKLMGSDEFYEQELIDSEFSKYWDLSTSKLPELREDQFDQFYRNWISKSQRENNIDEYGSLIFLQGLSSEWNKLNYRLIVKEK